MLRSKTSRLIVSVSLVLLAVWVATPKVYIHELLHHNHAAIDLGKETRVQTPGSSDDCEFHKYDKPAYFNIFKFIGNLVPSRPQNSHHFSEKALNLLQVISGAVSLRGPPAGY